MIRICDRRIGTWAALGCCLIALIGCDRNSSQQAVKSRESRQADAAESTSVPAVASVPKTTMSEAELSETARDPLVSDANQPNLLAAGGGISELTSKPEQMAQQVGTPVDEPSQGATAPRERDAPVPSISASVAADGVPIVKQPASSPDSAVPANTAGHGAAVTGKMPPSHFASSATSGDNAGVAPDAGMATKVESRNPSKEDPATGNDVRQTVSTPGEPELFAGWPTPRAVLVVNGRQHGYLEPCGCSGLDRQKGGLTRRFTLLKQLRDKGWKVIPIDAGNQVRRFGLQPQIKYQITIEGLKMMGYQAIGFGPDDLRLSAPELFAIISNTSNDIQSNPFVSANVAILDPSLMSTFRVLTDGGKKIGITSVLGSRNQKLVNNQDVQLQDAKTALATVWPKLNQQQCDLNVLIASGTVDESIELAKQFPGFDIVITTGGAGEPRLQPVKIQGTKVQLIEVGTKGMYAGVIGLFDDPATPIRYQRIPLDARFADSPEMLRLLAAYQDQLKAVGFSGLGIRPQPHPSGMKFVGSATCGDCHPKAYQIWKVGLPGHPAPHSRAYQTLLAPPKRANVPRNFDPECLSCHVVGWNPQQYYPYESGYLSLEKTPNLINVGCEDCHGPGARHSAAENGDIDVSDEELKKLQKAMALPLDKAEQKCLECHDLDNSPDFQVKGAFHEYWEKIKH